MESNERERMKTSEFRDVKLEKLLLAGIVKYNDILLKCFEGVDSEIFSSNRYKWIYEQVIEFYKNHSSKIDSLSFEVSIASRKQKERNILKKVWSSLEVLKNEVTKSGCYSIIIKLKKMYQARIMELNMSKAVGLLSKVPSDGDINIEKAKKIFYETVLKLEDKNENIILGDPLDAYEKFKKHHLNVQKDPEKFRGVLTGIDQLDNIMGGLRPAEFGLITAGTGKGKSIMLLDFAYNCFLSIGDILYITIEMPAEQLNQRFYCRLSNIEYDMFRDYRLQKEQWDILDRKIGKFLKEHEYKFSTLDAPQSCTTESLQHEIENFIKKIREPKLILIDYMNIMRGGMDWQKQLEIAVDIKQKIARYFKIATWSANQLAGAKHDKEHINISDFGFAKNIADNVDVGIGLAEADGSSEDNELFNIDFTKTRDFVGRSIIITADRSRMTFSKTKSDKTKTLLYKERKIGGEIKTQ